MTGSQAGPAWWRGTGYALAAGLLWPLVELAGAQLSRNHAPLQTVWLRYVAHVGVLLLIVVPRSGLSVLRTEHLALQLLRGLLMFLMPLAMVLGVGVASPARIWSVCWVAPLLMLVGAPLIGESSPAVRWLAGILGYAGAVAIIGAGASIAAALLPGLIMAGTLTGYVLISRRLRHERLATSLFYTGIGAVTPLTLLLPGFWGPVQSGDALAIAALGGVSLLALGCIDRATEFIGVSAFAPLLYSAVLFEGLLAVLHRAALPALPVLLGIALVLAAIGLTLLRPERDAARQAAGTTSKLERGLA